METQLVKVSSHTDLSVGSHTGDNYDDLGRVSATGRFRSSWVVANTPAPIANMRRVTVRVEWDENTGTKAVVLTSVRN